MAQCPKRCLPSNSWGPWKVSLKHAFVSPTFQMAGFQDKLLSDRPLLNFLPQNGCISTLWRLLLIPVALLSKEDLGLTVLNSAVMMIYMHEKENQWETHFFSWWFLKLFLKALLAETACQCWPAHRPLSLWIISHLCCLGIVFWEAPGLCTMRELVNSWLENYDFHFFLSILLGSCNEIWFSIPWWFDPCMKPQDGT